MTKFVISQNAILGDVMWGVLVVVNQCIMWEVNFVIYHKMILGVVKC
jgi:hypothetical protein